MKLNHLNLPVEDVKESKDFFEKYFDFKCIDIKGEHALAVLKGQDDFILVLMSETFNRNENAGLPSAFHVGFLVDTKEEVLNQFQKLKSGNIVLKNEPKDMRGIFGFYFIAPGNLLIEISTLPK
jgi:catechol 2,3-dioxygenase-like lactoylglutathione lyase family enzyme